MRNTIVILVSLVGMLLFSTQSKAQDAVLTCDGCPPEDMAVRAEAYLLQNSNILKADVMVYSPSTGIFREFEVTRDVSTEGGLGFFGSQDASTGFVTESDGPVQTKLSDLPPNPSAIQQRLLETLDNMIGDADDFNTQEFLITGTPLRGAADAIRLPDIASTIVSDFINENFTVQQQLALIRVAIANTAFSANLSGTKVGIQDSLSGINDVKVLVRFDDGTTWELQTSLKISASSVLSIKYSPTIVARNGSGELLPQSSMQFRNQVFSGGPEGFGDLGALRDLADSVDNVEFEGGFGGSGTGSSDGYIGMAIQCREPDDGSAGVTCKWISE